MTENNYREYRTIDKSAWPPGPWQAEPDKAQWIDPATNLDCLIVRNGGGALCGYFGVPEGHPLFGTDYNAVDVRVHGGLTFADRCADHSREAWERFRAKRPSWEVEATRHPEGDAANLLRVYAGGFDDYDHWVEVTEGRSICHVPAPGRPDGVWWLGFDCAHAGDVSPAYDHRLGFNGRDDVYRDLPYVRAQVARLAAQLHGLEPTP